MFGRCARQGDPGSCEAIVSLEDDVFDICAPRMTDALRRAMQSGVRLPKIAFSALRSVAQWSAERHHAGLRLQNYKQDRQLGQVLAFTGKQE